jgi:hypothetical protein
MKVIAGCAVLAALIFVAGAMSFAARTPASAQGAINPADFSPVITNRLFPLSSLGPKVLVGKTTDPDTDQTVEERLESRVLPDTAVVDGVTVLVLEEKAYVDGELVEVALDHFAQHKNGDVYYFGEHVDNYENGVVANHEGQWLAGENGNQPGVIMPAQPKVGVTYDQENAPGIAEDKAKVLSLTEVVSTPLGTYTNCMKTSEFTPLEPGVEEFKFQCPGVGLVREEAEDGFIQLVSMGAPPAPATPVPSATAAAVASATPHAGVIAPDTGDGPDAYERPMIWIVAVLAAGATLLAAGATLVRPHRRA